MYNHYSFIHAEHHVALESCVRNHTIITPALLAELYKLALANISEKQLLVAGKFTSHLKDQNALIGTATDEKTGFFVQLAKIEGQVRPMLTVGAKFTMEQFNPIQGSTNTVIW